jgi:hypothetical protein
MISRRWPAVVAALALAGGGCTFAVDHPAVAAGVSGLALGFGTCKLESDDYATCGAVGASVGVGLAVVTAVALWLGGDGHTVLVEDQARPLPDDASPPVRPRAPSPPAAPAPPPDAAPLPAPAPSPPPPSSP